MVDSEGETVKSFYRNDVEPNVLESIRWDGKASPGAPPRTAATRSGSGRRPGARRAAAAPAPPPPRNPSSVSLNFTIYGYAFPVLGRHDFGGAGGRFGAGRSGHTHQGQDVMARCGLPLVAARGGRVRFTGYQGAAGNYLVIDGRATGFDTAYMHLREPSPLKAGTNVRTGQPIGVVGRTGNASACHLHFEIWTAPGWYEGGSPIDPFPFLKRWDRYS